MKIRYGTFWLASGGIESPVGLSINGQQINDELQFYRALAVTLQPRGNRSMPLSFSVERNFDSFRAASRFAFGHFVDLPEQAALYIWIGTDADGEWIRFDGTVIDNVSPQQLGVSVNVAYSFRAALPAFESSPPDVTAPDTAMKATDTAIPADADTVAVVFATPFAHTPKITGLSVSMPAGGDMLWAAVEKDSVTVNGFTAHLSAPVPATGYFLTWSAIA